MDPGCGKTKAALDAVAIMALQGRCERVCVVTTLDGMGVWEEEIHEHYAGPCVVSLLGEPAYFRGQRGVGSSNGGIHPVRFFILNYERYRQRSRQKRRWEYPTAHAIERWAPHLFIFDEAHRLKRAGGVTAQLAWRSTQRIDPRPKIFQLTGTPNPKGWIDIFAQARVLNPHLLGTNKSDFEDDHVVYGKGSRRFTIQKYRGVKKLKRIVKPHAFIISKRKALPWLPAQTWQNVPFTLPPTARKLYDEMAEELLTSIGEEEISAKNIGARRIRLLQITGGYTTKGTVIHRARLEVARSCFEDLLAAEQHFVVFCRHLPEVEGVAEAIEAMGCPVEAISGRVGRESRRLLRRDFQRLAGPRSLVFQVATGSEAITLTRASEVLFYTLPDGWLVYRQACDRFHRPGQKNAVRYRHLLARGTVDRSVLHNLIHRADQHASLMGDPGAYLSGKL